MKSLGVLLLLILQSQAAQASCVSKYQDILADARGEKNFWYKPQPSFLGIPCGQPNGGPLENPTHAEKLGFTVATGAMAAGVPGLAAVAGGSVSTLVPRAVSTTQVHKVQKAIGPQVSLMDDAEVGDGIQLRKMVQDLRVSSLENVDLVEVANIVVDLNRSELPCTTGQPWLTWDELREVISQRMYRGPR